MSLRKMRSVRKEVIGTATPRYIIENNGRHVLKCHLLGSTADHDSQRLENLHQWLKIHHKCRKRFWVVEHSKDIDLRKLTLKGFRPFLKSSRKNRSAFSGLKLILQAEIPPLTRYSVLVEVKACALTEVDTKLMQLISKDSSVSNYSVGEGISGVVRDIGNSVSTLKPGDEVVGIVPLDYGISGCSEYVVVHEFDVTKKPEQVTFVDSAACIGDAVRSYTALHYLGRISCGDTVLIMDGASSFGSLCIQLATHWGAKVITTISSDDEKLYLEDLNDELALIIDLRKRSSSFNGPSYRNGNNSNSELIWSACMEETGGLGVDLIIDNGVTLFAEKEYRIVANGNYTYPVPSKHEIISALAVGGRWITSKENLQLDPPNSRLLFMKCASLGFLFEHAWTLSSAQQGQYLHVLMDIMEKVADKVIRPNIHHTVSFDSVAEAMKKLPSVKVGKIVMKMD